VSGSLSSATTGNTFAPVVSDRDTNAGGFNVIISGTFVATARLEKSVDNGVTWVPLTVQTGGGVVQLYTFTAPGADQVQEYVPGLLYRLNCTAYTSGTINYYLG
jgi:hypothetical protein